MPMSLKLGLGLSCTSLDGAPADVPYPFFAATPLAVLRQKSDFLGGASNTNIADVAHADSPYGSSAAEIVIRDAGSGSPQYFAPGSPLETPVDVRDGSVVMTFKPVANFGITSSAYLDRMQVELHSAGSPAAPTANYHQLTLGIGNIPYAFRRMSTAVDHSTPGRFQTWGFPIAQFSEVGSGADLGAIIFARLALRCSSGNTVTLGIGDIDFVPNPRTRAACIFRFDDAYASAYTYAKDALAAYGWSAVLYPGAVQSLVGAANRLTEAQIIDLCTNHGWQFGAQAWSTEDAVTLAAMSSSERLAEFAAIRAYGQSLGLRTDTFDGSYFSGFLPTRLDIFPEYRASFRTALRWDSGNPADPPIPIGEPFPFGDRYNVNCLNGNSASWGVGTIAARLQNHIEQAIVNKGVAFIAYHDDLATDGEARSAFEATLAYLDAHRDEIEVTTMKGLLG